jgi:hypothetical protein
LQLKRFNFNLQNTADMTPVSKSLMIALIVASIFSSSNAQTGSTSSSKKKTTTTAKKPAPAVSNKPVTITVQNKCTKDISLFAGPKADMNNPEPKMKTLGGLSKNTLYLKASDVVCILNAQKKPMACTNLKETTTIVEIDASGVVLNAK